MVPVTQRPGGGRVRECGCPGVRLRLGLRGCRRSTQGLARPPGTLREAEERGSGRGPGLFFAPRTEGMMSFLAGRWTLRKVNPCGRASSPSKAFGDEN